MLITVSGPPGSGKSTAADGLAAELGLGHVSGGDIFRELADEREMSLAEFGELAEADDRIDRNLDRRLREIAMHEDDLVLESRLAGWLAGDHADIRLWLDAPLDVRARRIADREETTVEQARQMTEAREASERKRYEAYYGIDIEDRRIYDLAMNTARWEEAAELAVLVGAIESYDPATDEGKAPVEGVSLPAP